MDVSYDNVGAACIIFRVKNDNAPSSISDISAIRSVRVPRAPPLNRARYIKLPRYSVVVILIDGGHLIAAMIVGH